MGVTSVGVPVSAGSWYCGAVSHHVASGCEFPGANLAVSWDEWDKTGSEEPDDEVNEVDEVVVAKRPPGRPRKVTV